MCFGYDTSVHMCHIGRPDYQVSLDALRYQALVRELRATVWRIGQIQHPDQGAMRVFECIPFTVDRRIATACRILLNIREF